jgi:hypothetical protein
MYLNHVGLCTEEISAAGEGWVSLSSNLSDLVDADDGLLLQIGQCRSRFHSCHVDLCGVQSVENACAWQAYGAGLKEITAFG